MQKITKLLNLLFSTTLLATLCCFIEGCSTILSRPQHLKVLEHSKITNKTLAQHFKTTGKIGFSDGKQGGHASIQWEQQGEQYLVRLFGPLGSGSIQITGNKKGVAVIRDDGKIFRAKNPDLLVEQAFGWIIPVSGLRYWLQGIPAPGTPPSQIQLDDAKRVWQIKQQGWIISYQAYQEVDDRVVPYKLLLQNGPIRLKFIFQQWKLEKN